MFRRQKGWFECGWIILLNIQTISRENGFKSDIQNVANVKIQNVWASERVVRVWRVLDYPFQRSRHLRCHANKIIAIKMVIIIVNTVIMVIIIVNMVIIMATMARPSPRHTNKIIVCKMTRMTNTKLLIKIILRRNKM